ncbi:hypothetical protein [Streptomyces sp. NPDC048385]|uniref:hypothetical protein n=1 Tax=Streptomyces sp. NPDC048385 TaxID=3155145 RepID=UPI003420137F
MFMQDYLETPRIVEGDLIQPGHLGRVDLGLYPAAGTMPEVAVTYEPENDLVTGSLLPLRRGDQVRLVFAVQNYGDVPCRARVTLTPKDSHDQAEAAVPA